MNEGRIQEIEDELRGTCMSIEEVIDEDSGESAAEVEVLISDRCEIERCDGCGWWCEASEMDDGNCEDCTNS